MTWLLAPPKVIAATLRVNADVPLRARLGPARSDFDAYVSDLDPHGGFRDWVPIDAPSDLGTHKRRAAWQVGESVIIDEATGALLDDAGFGYLPHGPDEQLEHGLIEALCSPIWGAAGGRGRPIGGSRGRCSIQPAARRRR